METLDPALADSAKKYWHEDGWSPVGVMRGGCAYDVWSRVKIRYH